ncbi:hypothetical protein Dda_3399 [Drechslerella dactyloides]|uniref:Uncharacterized protein n=1 Tax=Drechslerella dactyloides TaxID=74499 RepID=A0AAD6J181_DREDA|nr:hypothetical protein Dda_3399 [Drechslerella dactyloides]
MSARAVMHGLKGGDKTAQVISDRRDSVMMKVTQAKICKDLELKALFEKRPSISCQETLGRNPSLAYHRPTQRLSIAIVAATLLASPCGPMASFRNTRRYTHRSFSIVISIALKCCSDIVVD